MLGTIRKILWDIYGPLTPREEIAIMAEKYVKNIQDGNYSFMNRKIDILTQKSSAGKKRRMVYSFNNNSTEYILCNYLKYRLDSVFNIRYTDRKKIIKVLFNTLPVLNDLNDFVLIRFDFKSFFDSVPTLLIFEKYIKNSLLKRQDKDIFSKFCNTFHYCFAGLQTSNAMTEIVCEEFDVIFKAKLNEYGVIYFERYVDDMLIILNKYISENDFYVMLEKTIALVFENSKISVNKRKSIYISRRNFISQSKIDFLGYLFVLEKSHNKNDTGIIFTYGIAEAKRKKYTSRIRQTLIDFKKDKNIELLRLKIKLFSVRIVYSIVKHDDCVWITRGLINNYSELRFYLDNLERETKKFLKDIYFKLMCELNIKILYFMKSAQGQREASIYNLYSNLKRYRSIVFDERIGTRRQDLFHEIKKIEPSYRGKKRYYQLVNDYMILLKIKRPRGHAPRPLCNVQHDCNPAPITCVVNPEYRVDTTGQPSPPVF